MKIPAFLSIRTLASAARTAVYGSLTAHFALSEIDAQKMVDAVVISGVLADYVTWLLRNLVLMPKYLWHGCYDILINVLFGWFLMRYVRIDIGPDPELLGVVFLSFMLVVAVKTLFYSLLWVAETESE